VRLLITIEGDLEAPVAHSQQLPQQRDVQEPSVGGDRPV
jgi:hypothetical protein